MARRQKSEPDWHCTRDARATQSQCKSRRGSEFDRIDMTSRFVLLAVAGGLAIVRLVSADDNVRAVQMKLRDGGFYSGEIDGAYSRQLAAALTG